MKIRISRLLKILTNLLSCLEEPRKEGYYILKNFLSLDDKDFLLDKEIEIKRHTFRKLRELAGKRNHHYPFAYLFQKKEFYSLEFYVNEDVLVPRPETEQLVEMFLKEIKNKNKNSLDCLDVGTGSGCIPVSILKNTSAISTFIGIDISEKAIAVAKYNRDKLLEPESQDKLRLYPLDFLKQGMDLLPRQFDYIISNPPYILEKEKPFLEKEIFYEPPEALFVGDPFSFYGAFFQNAISLLKTGGKIFLETSPEILPVQMEILEGFPRIWREIARDYQNLPRFLILEKL